MKEWVTTVASVSVLFALVVSWLFLLSHLLAIEKYKEPLTYGGVIVRVLAYDVLIFRVLGIMIGD